MQGRRSNESSLLSAPLTAPFGHCRATRMKRRVCTSTSQQQQQRQARPAVAAALSAIWEQGISPALHSLFLTAWFGHLDARGTVRIPQRPTRFGCLNARHGSDASTPDTVRIPQRPRLDASYGFGHRSRMPHAWVPCGCQTRTLATLLPTCVCKLRRSRLTPCGEFVHDGPRGDAGSLPSRAPLAELVVCDYQ